MRCSGRWLAFCWSQRQANTRSEANARTTPLSAEGILRSLFQGGLYFPHVEAAQRNSVAISKRFTVTIPNPKLSRLGLTETQ